MPTKLERISSYEDARAKARYALPRALFDYIDGGAEGEYTMRRNVEAFEQLVWRPRQAVYHEQIDTATEVLGTKLAMPVMTAPSLRATAASRSVANRMARLGRWVVILAVAASSW